MTEADLTSIERELGVELPEPYRRCVVPCPLRALRGNAETELWDDPHALAVRNRALHTGESGLAPWPNYLLAIGQVLGDPSVYAIDLRHPAAPVWWVDHGDATADSSGVVSDSLEGWLDELKPQLAEQVVGLGLEPDAEPEEPALAAARDGRTQTRLLIGVIMVVSLMLVVFAAFIGS